MGEGKEEKIFPWKKSKWVVFFSDFFRIEKGASEVNIPYREPAKVRGEKIGFCRE